MQVSTAFQNSPRPPTVSFEERSAEDRDASQKAGRKVFKSVDWVTIRALGSRDTVEKEALPWLEHLPKENGFLPEWVDQYRAAYARWKSGHEVTPDGSHVRSWAAIGKGEADTLIAAGIHTVEDLANAPESALVRVGIGARRLQQQARAWLSSADKGVTAEKLLTLQTTQEQLVAQIGQLRKLVDDLRQENLNLRAGHAPAAGSAPVAPSTPDAEESTELDW